MQRRIGAVLVLAALAWGAVAAVEDTDAAPTPPEVCRDCHLPEFEAWQRSDHFQSMRLAEENAVLGDFSDVRVRFHGIESRFFRTGDEYRVETVSASGERGVFPVRYTFGWRPLQQYLLDAGDSRLQAFDVAWDDRPAAQGGQRWFHLQPDEEVVPGHPFFWTGHAMHWGSQCAACHSTHVTKSADASGHLSTAFEAANVTCEACHGNAAVHVRHARAGTTGNVPHAGFVDGPAPRIAWRLAPGERIATPDKAGDSREIDQCGGCHALRTPLVADARGKAFHDAYRIELVDSLHYFPDGQIREEVFVLGSFLQSRMHARGVTCGNCHDPHSGGLVAEGNGVCSQCHRAASYDVPTHHHHAAGTSGSACIDCHMPARTYMGVDPRRDHAFPIPRPSLSAEFGVPNACTGCHEGRSDAWAQEKLSDWGFAEKDHWTRLSERLHRGDPAAADDLHALVAGDTPPMVKAGLLAQATTLPSHKTRALLALGLGDAEPLVRRGAVAGAHGQPPAERWRLLAPRMDDPVASVRFETAIALADIAPALPARAVATTRDLFAEQRQLLASTADLAETQRMLGNLEVRLGQRATARAAFERALTIDPTSVPALIDYADFLQREGQEREAGELLARAIGVAPDSPIANVAYGLHLVRDRRRQEALAPLAKAAATPDASARFLYIHAVAQHSLGHHTAALETLRAGIERWPWDPNLLSTLVIYLDDPQSPETQRHLATLAELEPD
ncbi:MAG: multiheme c-type cytochrome [Gammaproteobacteria bacterium]|nr:multiheme c-type cytochrome [Gammaproteobacteria bacterium]